MATKLLTVEDNNAPDMVLTLERDGTPIDVTGATVALIIKNGSTITNTGHQTCTLTTPASGVVTYSPEATDFATEAMYDCEVKITYGDTTVETLYEKFKVKARAKLS